ncbi:MAG: hypothetical protein P8N67_11365 [Pseudomonadales bacterium]|nr:hypothetical protein [Pseudomonadales bacterium]
MDAVADNNFVIAQTTPGKRRTITTTDQKTGAMPVNDLMQTRREACPKVIEEMDSGLLFGNYETVNKLDSFAIGDSLRFRPFSDL